MKRRALFIHARLAWDLHDFVEKLRKLTQGIERAMYLEGGPEASLSVRAGGASLDAVGSYETGFNENTDNARQWELPNVIGVTRTTWHAECRKRGILRTLICGKNGAVEKTRTSTGCPTSTSS